MTELHIAAFDSPLMALGIAWSGGELVRVLLPIGKSDRGDARGVAAMERALAAAYPKAKKRSLDGLGERAADAILAHLRGDPSDVHGLPLTHGRVSPFARGVYEAARKIPIGQTRTYADIAESLGSGAMRAVGAALGKNPWPIVVPCHRVLGSSGAGGFSAPGGLSTKAQLLAMEGGSLDDAEHRRARAHLSAVAPELRPWIRSVSCGLPTGPRGADGLGIVRALVRAIVGQQLSTKAAATIFSRVESAMLAATPDARGARPGDVGWLVTGEPSSVWSSAPLARLDAIADDALRGCGLSAAKLAAIRDLSAATRDGRLPLQRLLRAPDDMVVEALQRVRGIGRWTAEMLLIFELGRADVMPDGDLGIQKALTQLDGRRKLLSPEEVRRRTASWAPYRSVGAFYLWRTLDA